MSVDTVEVRGLECRRLQIGGASVTVARFGGHVLSWVPADGRERLFLSERAITDGSAPIRGGIPVCWPQFSGLGDLPKHGLLRNRVWEPFAISAPDSLAFALRDDESSRVAWPHGFEARLAVTLGATRLTVSLAVRNTGAAPFRFTGALHTYFAVDDIARVSVTGLAGREYRDAAGGNRIVTESETALRFSGEVDRVYHDVPDALVLEDGLGRTRVTGEGFADVVVWNPWSTLCAGLPDMLPDGYRRMVCIEAAAARLPVEVAPGTTWIGRQVLEAL
jgi:glucose-6-phosphate 1-epimerase